MKYLILLLFPLLAFSQPRTRSHTALSSSGATTIQANVSPRVANQVSISVSGQYRYIKSNGIPDHNVGEFPNSGNPHEIIEQSNSYKVPSNPKLTGSTKELPMAFDFGVALNGVPFDPGAAEWYQGDRNSDWQYEALSGAVALGVDENHAHVQPTGAYHYHGLPKKLLQKLGLKKGKMSPLIGYAADGFPIYAIYGESGKEMKSSFVLKSGTRPIGGTYDGTFVADYIYKKGKGDLDECNGLMTKNGYAYFLTRSFPVIPRCWKGSPDDSFKRGRSSGGSQMHQHGRGGKIHSHRRGRHHRKGGHRGGPPEAAINACSGKSVGDSCYFSTNRGSVRGTCFSPPHGGLACRP